MTSKLEIISDALLELGDSPITSLSATGAGPTAAKQRYDSVLHDALSKAMWTFAKSTASLSKLVAEPDTGFQAAYLMPSDYVRAIRVIPAIRYELYQNELHCDQVNGMTLVYTAITGEGLFTPSFRQYFMLLLASAIAIPTTQNASLATEIAVRAERKLVEASRIDASTQTSRTPPSSPLITVRR